MNNKIKTENFWIIIVWVVVFMLILSWDQEKIVVLNLVLFCYFLRYLVGNSIEATLSQRRTVLLDSLLIDLNTQISLLTKLVEESKTVLNIFHALVVSLLKKTLISTNNMILTTALASQKFFNFDFTVVQLALQAAYDETLSKQLDQNIFISSQIILDVSPTFAESEEVE